MSGWQDSFVPDNPPTFVAPQAVQASGWQSSFVPDDQTSKNQSATDIGNLSAPLISGITAIGNRLTEAAKDVVGDMINSVAQVGAIDRGWGGQDDTTKSFDPSSGSDWLAMGLPFAGVAGAIPERSTAAALGEGLVIPKSSDISLIKQKLDLAGVTPQQYADALLKSSPDDFAGELGGDPLRVQTQAQAKITGPAMQAARDAMRQRLDTAPQRVQQIIEQTFYPSSGAQPVVGGDPSLMRGASTPLEPVQQMQINLSDIKGNLPALYKAADTSTVSRKPFLNIINTPNGQIAMKNTVARLANQNIQPEAAGIVVDSKTGFYGLQPAGVPVSTMREVSKSFGDLVQRNPMTGAIEDTDSLLAEQQRQHVTSALSQNSPAFNTANTNAAAQLQGQSAFESGRRLAHAAAGENADALAQRAANTFSPQELSYHKAGYAQGLGDALQGSPLGGGNPAARIAKGTVQNTTADILQNPTLGQKFADALMQEKNRVELAQRGLNGSNTAETLSAGLPEIPHSAEGLLSSGAKKVMDFLNAGKEERIAQLLYATSPEQKAILAQRILR